MKHICFIGSSFFYVRSATLRMERRFFSYTTSFAAVSTMLTTVELT